MMDYFFYSLNFIYFFTYICCIVHSEGSYGSSPFHLEEYCKGDDGNFKLHIAPWHAAIFKVGFWSNETNKKSPIIKNCKISIRANAGFLLTASIEHLKIRGKRNKNNKWICEDYIKFSSPARHLPGRILSYLDIHTFSAKSSEELCGEKKLDSSNVRDVTIVDMSTDANTFYSYSNKMNIVFHQHPEDGIYNNSAIIIITTFRHSKEEVACENKFQCIDANYCIDPSLKCDGHINCAFPGSGDDELICEGLSEPNSYSTTSIIIIILISAIGAGCSLCILASLLCRLWSGDCYKQRETTDPDLALSDVSPSAPNDDLNSTIPRYEDVISADGDRFLKSSNNDELPPTYDTLFPEGPPRTDEIENVP